MRIYNNLRYIQQVHELMNFIEVIKNLKKRRKNIGYKSQVKYINNFFFYTYIYNISGAILIKYDIEYKKI
jgi:hypothetical protein